MTNLPPSLRLNKGRLHFEHRESGGSGEGIDMSTSAGNVRDLGVGVVASDFAVLPALFPSGRVRREGGLREGGVDGPLECVAASEKSEPRSGVGGRE